MGLAAYWPHCNMHEDVSLQFVVDSIVPYKAVGSSVNSSFV